jgi:four helix bundle protein
MAIIRSHKELDVYKLARSVASDIFKLSRQFPKEERYSLTDQIRRSSRSVCSNITKAWRKRRYEASFVYKLSDADAEAAETQTWIEFALDCGYWDAEVGKKLSTKYDRILGMLVTMMNNPGKWVLTPPKGSR